MQDRAGSGRSSKRTLALLAYLGLHADRAVPRDALAAALWPDVPDSEARANLRRHLALLNAFLPADPDKPWLLLNGRNLRWNLDSSSWFDTIEFERLATEPATMAEAVDLYEGDIFETLDDEWIVPIRERYRERFLVILAELLDAHEHEGDVAGMLHFGRLLVRFDPMREDVVRRLMLARAATGDRAGALQEFKEFEKRLADEMAAEPMPETSECYERVRRGEVVVQPHEAPAPKSNLPQQLTSFIGRDSVIAEISALLKAHRLVTLTGSAGVGKTRTSLQVAGYLRESYGNGVWFIELAPLSSGDYIASTIAQTMGVGLVADGHATESLVKALKTKHVLLVLDNCEHLVGPAGRVVAAILRDCPKATILATSRQALGIAGEQMYRMPSLDGTAALALFTDRACAADSRFAVTDKNAPAVAEICRRLDGIPLAIELAAARVKILSPKQLRDHLDERFQILTGGSRDALPRHQTLRAMIDWSFDLLDERERTLFRRLGIFVNGFTLEGAVAVGSGGDLDVLNLLASLVDKSLVLAEPDGDALRYRLLESTRAYALDKLLDAGELDPVAGRHLDYLHKHFAELRARQLQTARLTELSEALRAEQGDVRMALDGALMRGNIVRGGWLVAEVGSAWSVLGLHGEGVGRIEKFLAALPEGEPLLLARLSTELAGRLDGASRRTRAFAVATQAVEYARASGDATVLATALQIFAATGYFLGKLDEAEAALAEAEKIPAASAWLRVSFLGSRALLSHYRGDLETAARIHDQLRKEHHALGNTYKEQVSILNLAETEHSRGRTQRSIELARENIPALRLGSDKVFLSKALGNLAGYLAATDDLVGAAAAAREAIEALATSDPDSPQVAIGVDVLALVSALRGERERAAVLEGYADPAFERLGYKREFTETKTYDRLIALLRAGVAPDTFARLTAEGAALTPAAAIALALEER
ncbi:MAG TPA: BTAD domain-containing putative transcriptional regulator [Candidatus Baltobacteraceae bacterium]|nr:BTAD domain-containing putative transcriptional regulator [Candidatus Baltobacteraceae bacterium]